MEKDAATTAKTKSVNTTKKMVPAGCLICPPSWTEAGGGNVLSVNYPVLIACTALAYAITAKIFQIFQGGFLEVIVGNAENLSLRKPGRNWSGKSTGYEIEAFGGITIYVCRDEKLLGRRGMSWERLQSNPCVL